MLTETTRPWRERLQTGLRHAFALDSPHGPLKAEDHELMARLARKVVSRELSMPAIMLLQSVRPLSCIGSQAMVFLRPFLTPLFNGADYDRVVAILDRRDGIAALIDAIEAAQAAKEGPAL